MHNKPPVEQQPCGQRELPPCGDFADRLVDLSDGELSPAEAAIVREHCEECPACRLTLVRLDRSLAVLADALVSNMPDTNRPVADQLAESSIVQPVSRSTAPRRGWTSAIAAGAAALVLAAMWLSRDPADSRPEEGSPPRVAQSSPHDADAVEQPIRPTENPDRDNDSLASNSRERETPERIARRLALIEQVARLEASLAMTPDDPWFASQRTANERLLAGFRQAVEELSTASDKSKHIPSYRDEVL
jgi:hypothetical protein